MPLILDFFSLIYPFSGVFKKVKINFEHELVISRFNYCISEHSTRER